MGGLTILLGKLQKLGLLTIRKYSVPHTLCPVIYPVPCTLYPIVPMLAGSLSDVIQAKSVYGYSIFSAGNCKIPVWNCKIPVFISRLDLIQFSLIISYTRLISFQWVRFSLRSSLRSTVIVIPVRVMTNSFYYIYTHLLIKNVTLIWLYSIDFSSIKKISIIH